MRGLREGGLGRGDEEEGGGLGGGVAGDDEADEVGEDFEGDEPPRVSDGDWRVGVVAQFVDL